MDNKKLQSHHALSNQGNLMFFLLEIMCTVTSVIAHDSICIISVEKTQVLELHRVPLPFSSIISIKKWIPSSKQDQIMPAIYAQCWLLFWWHLS